MHVTYSCFFICTLKVFLGERSEIFALRKIYSTNLANRPSGHRPGDCSSDAEWTGMRPKCWAAGLANLIEHLFKAFPRAGSD